MWSALEPQVLYEQGGYMVCTHSDTPHGGLGMCTRCFPASSSFGSASFESWSKSPMRVIKFEGPTRMLGWAWPRFRGPIWHDLPGKWIAEGNLITSKKGLKT